MPEQYKVPTDSIQAYHNYYINDKQPFAVWTNRPIPPWYVSELQNRNYKPIYKKLDNKVQFRMVSCA
jgi:hypothetical protein